ncbi:3-hydroxybutyryl-CoA dehydrogenase [Cohnella yongneupensis]|uniref:3-hydroxybutyryl-CoA dehydrogenase n=1 Tax=Cohnella yongneupensis TaxID=425006 RepID=A0ABW0R254_9BACL
MAINTVIVFGAGQMGSGIAQVAATAGLNVILSDVRSELVDKGLQEIKSRLTRDEAKGRRSAEESEQIWRAISPSVDSSDARHADLVIEAVVENREAKARLFERLDTLCPPDVIFASNTSSLPITELAAVTNRPDKVIGMHFMNPVPVMKLVEVVRGLATSDDTYETIRAVSEQLGKIPVAVNDYPGFVSNRILLPMINEAIYCVYEGVASPEAVDDVMRLGMNHPMGPLALADFIGLDTCLSIMEILHNGLGDSKYRPCPLLRKYVRAGWLGRKSGRGFYRYTD